MTCADPSAIVTVEIFVEENVITELRVFLEFCQPTVEGARPVITASKELNQATRQVLGHVLQGDFIT